MAEDKLGKLADAFRDEDCFTIDEFADELSVSVQRIRQIVTEAFKKGYVQKLVKTKGKQNLYAPVVVDKVKELYHEGKFGKPRQKNMDKVMEKNAAVLIKVPVYDRQAADYLMKKFGGEEEIQKFLRGKLEEVYQPALRKIEELKARHQKELQEALKGI